jgi:hypothetical protein
LKLNVATSIRVDKETEDGVLMAVEQVAFHVETANQVEKGMPLEVKTMQAFFELNI